MSVPEFPGRNSVGIHYAVRIFIGTTILWFLTKAIHAESPLWAIISLIIVTEPHAHLAWIAFRNRMINTLMGALVGFAVLAFAGPTPWALIPAITFTALIATIITHAQQGWRIAPITTALVISAGLTQQSATQGMEVAITRTFEVFMGSAVALIISVIMARLWLPPQPAGEAEKK